MNEEAIKDAYTLFSQGGYNGDINQFKKLISSNGNALKDAYSLFNQGGYNGDINEFKSLMGISSIKKQMAQVEEPVKKKNLPYRLPNWVSLLRLLLPKRMTSIKLA